VVYKLNKKKKKKKRRKIFEEEEEQNTNERRKTKVKNVFFSCFVVCFSLSYRKSREE